MTLPHQEPLIFAQKVISKNDTTSQVLCRFNFIPTLATFIEAAAQSSSSFKELREDQIGFLTTVKNIKQLDKIKSTEYIFHVTLEIDLGNISKFSFIAYDKISNIAIVSGEFTAVLED